MAHEGQPLSAGTPVRAVDFPRAQRAHSGTVIGNITDTSYTVGSPGVAVRFMAPSSGKVAVVVSAGTQNNVSTNNDRVFVAFRILEGDPADDDLFQSEDAKLGVSNNANTHVDEHQYGGMATMVDGLTPGTFYYAQIRYRTTLGSGTADIAYRAILVFPLP